MILSEIQNAIVRHDGGNVLVSAAAGSGKTTVMTERIIRIITDEKRKVSVSRLLVVTFTNAAAAHMKEVIFRRLRQLADQEPENRWISEQLMAFPMARIMTIDAFCLRVIKDNIHLLKDLDPSFRVAGDNEVLLLRKDCLAQTLEDLYLKAEREQEAYQDFLFYIKKSCGKKSDAAIEAAVDQIFLYLLSLPEPLLWLEDKTEDYAGSALSPELEQILRELVRQKISETQEGFRDLRDASEPEYKYFDGIVQLFGTLAEAASRLPLSELLAALAFKYPSRARKIADQYDSPEEALAIENRIKKLKARFRDFVKALQVAYQGQVSDSSEDRAQRAEQYLYLSGLRKILKGLFNKYAAAKAERSLIDFSDFSHFALDILCQKDENGIFFNPSVPTVTAFMMAEGIDYIFIDEYQDSNTIQELILTAVSRRDDTGEPRNIFMVGDVKQSIYRFRNAEPDLFMEKSKSYRKTTSSDASDDLTPRKFILSENRRSEKAILDAGNFVFTSLMNGETAEILYDEDERLNFPPEKPRNPSEVVLTVIPNSLSGRERAFEEMALSPDFSEDSEDALTAKEAKSFEQEAQYIACSIRDMIAEKKKLSFQTDKGQQEREVCADDIAVLLPKIKGLGHIMKQALDSVGVSSVTEASRPFFESPEIVLVCQILSIVDNPRQDIPLVSVLHSPCFEFSSDDLARIRLSDPSESFYEALVFYRDNYKNVLSKKISAFLTTLEEWRRINRHESVHNLLWAILLQSDYYIYVSAMPDGENRKANLDKLLELSVSFENSTYSGLYQFLRYLDMVEKYESEEGEAHVESGESVVRIMTIHKSKGLEFPVVFLGGLGSKLLFGNTPAIITDRELGFGIPLKCKGNDLTLRKIAIKAKSEYREKAERMRLLYVGMTRAVSCLYMSGMGEGFDELLCDDGSAVSEFGTAYRLSSAEAMSAGTYLDWFRLILTKALQNGVPCPFRVRRAYALPSPGEDLEQSSEDTNKSRSETAFSAEDFQWQYPFSRDLSLKARYSVSEIKKNARVEKGEAQTDDEKTVSLISWDGKGAERGTIMHTFFAAADWAQIAAYEDVEKETERLIRKELMTSEEAKLLFPSALWKFRNSDLCARMLRSPKVWKEQPFILSLGIEELRFLSDAWSSQLGEDTSSVMIQGIIDLFFEEDGALVLVDYKTDMILGESELKMYGLQLEIYKRALERILRMPVKEKFLYSTARSVEIKV